MPAFMEETDNKQDPGANCITARDKSYREESRRVGRWRSGRSNGMMKGGLTEKVTFEQRLCGDLGKCYKGKEEPVQRS